MSFWSTDKIEEQHAKTPLVAPFNPGRMQQGAYELSMGPQGAISSDDHNQISNLAPREAFCIPRGQFALLLTEEIVTIPDNVIAFISLKTSVKSLGLVNVSGFHVDPGFKCRLKFWVYNAGNQPIQVLRGDPVFLIWFSDLDRPTRDPYSKNSPAHNEITGADLRCLRGHLASPAALAKQIEHLEHKVEAFKWIGGTAVAILIGLCIALATPLLDYILKPVIDRFSRSYPAVTATPAANSPATTATAAPAVASPPSTSTVKQSPPPPVAPKQP